MSTRESHESGINKERASDVRRNDPRSYWGKPEKELIKDAIF